MSDICNNIISAIDILTNQKIAEAGYDRTIVAQIISCVNPAASNGAIYKLKYQNSTLYATERNTETTYNIGDLVYIKIPQNDFSQEKIIEGKVSKNKDSVNATTDALTDIYEIIGYNSINTLNEITMTSFEQENLIYSTNEDLGYLTIDTTKLKNSTVQANSLIFQADFKTIGLDELNGYYRGNYGLKITLVFKGIDETGKFNEEIKKDYLLDINSVEGNPYNSVNYVKAVLYINNIKEYTFDRIESISYFASNFPENESKDILINNIVLYGANWITREELKNAAILINLYAHEGIDLVNNNGVIPLTVSGRIGKIKVEDLSSDLSLFWFKENTKVDAEDHDKYNKYGGIGWECLNTREQGYNEAGEIDDTVLGEWKTGSFTYNITHSLFETSPITEVASIRIKAVAIYSDGKEEHSDESNILVLNNKTSATDLPEFLLTSISTKQNRVDLICQCNETDLTTLGFDEIIYYWRNSIPTVSKNVLSKKGTYRYNNIDLIKIKDKEIFSCTIVGIYEGEEYVIGEASITLVGTKVTSKKEYSIKFYHKKLNTIVYKNSGLITPTNYVPYIQALLYTPENKLIDPELCSYSWTVSNSNLINPIYDFFAKIWGIITKKDIKSYFFYNLAQRYAKEYEKEATITVTIIYQDIKVEKSFTINFEQESEAGKESSQTGVTITTTNQEESLVTEEQKYPTINTTKGTSTSFLANFFSGVFSKWSPSNILWSFFKKDNTTLEASSSATYSLRSSTVVDWTSEQSPQFTATYPETEEVSVNNLIKVEATNEIGETYYDIVAPILVNTPNENYNIELKYGTGFQEVEFSADGRDAKFLNRPFEAVVTPVEDVTYKWILQGNAKEMFTIVGSNTEKTCIVDINSSKRYDGIYSDLAIECLASKDGAVVAKMYIPIYIHLSTYNNSAIQGWDGTGIVLDEASNSILTPQLGAGKKENANFTGIVLGQQYTDANTDIGLFGYHNNERTIFLDAKTGSAVFGATGDNQIILDPVNEKLTVHGDIYANNGYFKGKIEATSGTFYGRIEAEEGYFKNGEIDNLWVTGNLYYSEEAVEAISTFAASDAYYIGTGGDNSDYIHVPNFRVGKDSSEISGFNFNNNALYKNKSTLTDMTEGVYLGTNGIALGNSYSMAGLNNTIYSAFEVASNGEVKMVKNENTYISISPNDSTAAIKIAEYNYDNQDYDNFLIASRKIVKVFSSTPDLEAGISIPYVGQVNAIGNEWYFNCYVGINDELAVLKDAEFLGTVYTASGTVSKSDETKKNTITPLSEQYSLLFDNLQPVTFKYNDGTSDRLHTGFGARATEQAVLDAGLTTKDFAAVCYDIDEEGNKVDYGIRYEEIVALNTYEIQKLKARINELETIIQELKNQ